VLDVLGPERVVIGSDYPFDMGQDDPVAFLAGAGLTPDVRAGIEHANAARFLALA
jgi:aminocarboxymuconate-semialdehyde decarboxylase